MNYITKYSFYDFYKDRTNLSPTDFLPTDDARFNTFKFLDENTIFLAGSIPKRDSIIGQNNFGVIFLSKDKGKSYQQILFPEENVTFVSLSTKYSLVQTNSNGYSTKGKNCIYLLDNLTFQFKKIDEYSSNDEIYYEGFNGEYVIYSKGKNIKLINLFSKEEYIIPDFLKDKLYAVENGTSFIYLNEKEILKYNIITKKTEIIKKLKNNYDFMNYKDGYFELSKFNLLKTEATIYNIDENKIYTSDEKTEKRLYRYKNFACRLSQNMPYAVLDYSYDYGKTWYRYKDEKFITSSTPKGFYKDKYILIDTGFYGAENNTDIIIGEFVK